MPGGCPGGGMLKLRFDWYISWFGIPWTENSLRSILVISFVVLVSSPSISKLLVCVVVNHTEVVCTTKCENIYANLLPRSINNLMGDERLSCLV